MIAALTLAPGALVPVALVSAGTEDPASFKAFLLDGGVERTIFETNEPLVTADTDTSTDVYLRRGALTVLLSGG